MNADECIKRACEDTGFEKCEFLPKKDNPCEKCSADYLQLYFRGPDDAGSYFCADCVIAEHQSNLDALAELEQYENEQGR